MNAPDTAPEFLRREFLRDALSALSDVLHHLARLQADPDHAQDMRFVAETLTSLRERAARTGEDAVRATLERVAREVNSRYLQDSAPLPAELAAWIDSIDSLAAAISPRADASGMGAHASPANRIAGCVLLVDGDDSSRETTAASLRRGGYITTTASTRAEALRLAEGMTQALDAVITDVLLPDGFGHEVVEMARGNDSSGTCCVIALTRQTALKDRLEALESGADAVIEKPVIGEILLRRIARALRARRGSPPAVLAVAGSAAAHTAIDHAVRDAGLDADFCRTASEFDGCLHAIRPTAVLIDASLEWASPYELARYTRQTDAFASTHLILVHGDPRLGAEARGAGFNDVIGRPIRPAELRAIILSAHAARVRAEACTDRDPLTDLLHASAFLHHVGHLLSRRPGAGSPRPVLALLDIDGLAAVNERFGYHAGDRVLLSLTALIRRALRSTDVIARLDGDMFAILLDRISAHDAVTVVGRIREDFSSEGQSTPDGRRFDVSMSAGLAPWDPSLPDADAWLEAASDALARAKAGARARSPIPASSTLR